MERDGSTLADIYDNTERGNYAKIVLQKRMWIHVAEDQLLRQEATKQSPDLSAWRARQEAERERIRQLDHTPLPPKRPPKKPTLQQNYQNVLPSMFAPRPFNRAPPSRPRPVVPPKPVISRELVQNLINSAASANSPSLNFLGLPASAAYQRPISAAKSLESLLSEPVLPPQRIDRHVTVSPPVGTNIQSANWIRARPLSSERLPEGPNPPAAGTRSSTLPAGADRLMEPNCDSYQSNENGGQKNGGKAHVAGHVASQVVLTAPPSGSPWRSKSMHQLNLASPDTSPGLRIDRRSPSAGEENRGGKKRCSQEMEIIKIQQAQLIQRISGKLTILREERDTLKVDIANNEKKGELIAEEVSCHAKLQEVDRLRRHMQEVENLTSLLVGLSSRLARAEAEADQVKREEDVPALRAKQNKLQSQLIEAKGLQEVMQRREENLVKMVSSYLGANSGNAFQSYIRTKSELIMELKEIEDKIKLGEEQLNSLALFS